MKCTGSSRSRQILGRFSPFSYSRMLHCTHMTLSRDAVSGLIVLAVVSAGVVWYAVARPAPTGAPGETATSTPAEAGAAEHITESGQYYDIDAAYPSATALAATAGTDADA